MEVDDGLEVDILTFGSWWWIRARKMFGWKEWKDAAAYSRQLQGMCFAMHCQCWIFHIFCWIFLCSLWQLIVCLVSRRVLQNHKSLILQKLQLVVLQNQSDSPWFWRDTDHGKCDMLVENWDDVHLNNLFVVYLTDNNFKRCFSDLILDTYFNRTFSSKFEFKWVKSF